MQRSFIFSRSGNTSSGNERILVGVNRTGRDIYFNGTNVHITDGSGTTDGKVNGLGNLIIGYNEPGEAVILVWVA